MYTSYIGKIFLDYYKEKNNLDNNYSAENFFDEVMFPLFFDSESHLLHVGNSPFFQRPSDKDIEKYGSKSLTQLNNLKEKIKTNNFSGAIYVGYGAENIQATTSAQITSLDININSEEVYYSWIGAALGIGVNGGLVLLINKKEILWALFEGWEVYRKYLQDTPSLKDKQIETWNGHWICKRLVSKKSLDYDKDELSIETENVLGKIAIPTNSWVNIIFTLSKKYQKDMITAYIYNLSQTNTTLGFINLFLSEVSEIYEIRDKYFINEKETILNDQNIMKLETFYNLKSACKFGSIGLKALEPKQLREFLPRGTYEYSKGNDFKYNENNQLNFLIIKLWIYAMINKKELLDLADKFAKILYEYETQKDNSESRGKTGKSQDVKELLENNSINKFLEKLSSMISDMKNHLETIKNMEIEILTMPRDNFPLFITLIKFEYTILKNSTQNKEK